MYFVRPGSSSPNVLNYIIGNDHFIGTFEPGKYRFHTIQQYPRKGNSEDYSTLSIELEANKRYYLKPMRSGDSDALKELTVHEGESSIEKCKLSGIPQFVSAGFKTSNKKPNRLDQNYEIEIACVTISSIN